MNIAIVYFSYDGDLPFWEESFKSIERLKKNTNHQITTYVSIEGKDCAAFHKADVVGVCRYGREGGLRGRECFQEMLELYANILTKHDIIIKVDSDTIINDLSWLEQADFSKTGFVSTTKSDYYSCGGSYVISRVGIHYLIALFSRVDIRGRLFNLDDYKESIAVHRLFRFGGVSYGEIRTNNIAGEKPVALYEDFVQRDENQYTHKYPDYETLNKHYAVTFRSDWSKTSGERNRSLSRMRNFNKWKEEHEKD